MGRNFLFRFHSFLVFYWVVLAFDVQVVEIQACLDVILCDRRFVAGEFDVVECCEEFYLSEDELLQIAFAVDGWAPVGFDAVLKQDCGGQLPAEG